MRTEFKLDGLEDQADAFEAAFAAEVAEPFGMDWQMRYASQRKRVCIFVSRYDHCLAELLWRWRRGELYADIPLVISNHAEMEREAARFDVRFEHVPVTPDTKPAAEARAARAARRHVRPGRARALHADPVADIPGGGVGAPIINIHHSFLPAFAGANPYARAYERGVKLIGATAHYVTEELDAGPIIEQDVERVTHRETIESLERAGRGHRAHRAHARGAAGTSRTGCSCTATGRSCSSCNARGSCRHSPVDDDLTPLRRGAAGGGRPGRVPGALHPVRRAHLRLLRAPVRRPRRGVRPHGRDVRAGVDHAPPVPRRGGGLGRAVAVRHRTQRAADVGPPRTARARGGRAARRRGATRRPVQPATAAPEERWAEGADELLDELPASQREAVRLRVVDQLDYEEVALTLGTSPAAARVRVHRGLAALRGRR